MVRLSENFDLKEFTRSDIAKARKIKNKPNTEEVANIRNLVLTVLQPLRDHLKVPIKIHSGFRSEEINRLAGGVPDSDHRCLNLKAAADITAEGISNEKIAATIFELKLPIDQVIVEYDQKVLHVSARRPKNEYLSRRQESGKLFYSVFDPSAVKPGKTKPRKAKASRKPKRKSVIKKTDSRKKKT